MEDAVAWAETAKADPIMEGKTKGNAKVIEWNSTTQLMLGSPISVEVFYDEATQRLGFRGVQYFLHLQVLQTEDYTYGIDVTAELEGIGLVLPAQWEATPRFLPDGETLPTPLVPWVKEPYEICIDIPT
jgi:hypothetical protein